jgi:uncharacterized protein with von Willebrand factor type A (vWA) domain
VPDRTLAAPAAALPAAAAAAAPTAPAASGAHSLPSATPARRTDDGAIAALAGFASMLREHGLGVGVTEQQAMLRAALALPLPQQQRQIEAAWRAIACHDRRDWQRWPDLFERYWQPQRQKGSTKLSGQTRPARDMRQLVQAMQQGMDEASTAPLRPGQGLPDAALDGALVDEQDNGRPLAQGGASRTEALHDRSLAMWLPQDLAQLNQLAERIALSLRQRLTRRWRDQPQGRRLDLRRTLRASLKTGGEPMAPAWRAPRRERPKLFILVDVSRSMQTHAQLFLRIARALVGPAGARVFVFHTRLAEITPLLQRDSANVQEKVNAVTAGFGGGTRIATSVADFSQVHARAQLRRGARVWILSDGFDADPPEALAAALARVRARGARITWFHPTVAPPASLAMAEVQAQGGLVERFLRLASLRDLAAAVPHLH